MSLPNPTTFFDIQRGKSKLGRVKMELWSSRLPKTCENFRQLCTGEYIKNGRPTGYKESCFFEVTPEHVQGGNFNNNVAGEGGESVYGGDFQEEEVGEGRVEEEESWVVSMVKGSKGGWNSLFQIDMSWEESKR
jgi:peptidyl-prolyl isomerase H (cyclophilin H)